MTRRIKSGAESLIDLPIGFFCFGFGAGPFAFPVKDCSFALEQFQITCAPLEFAEPYL